MHSAFVLLKFSCTNKHRSFNIRLKRNAAYGTIYKLSDVFFSVSIPFFFSPGEFEGRFCRATI